MHCIIELYRGKELVIGKNLKQLTKICIICIIIIVIIILITNEVSLLVKSMILH